jgi:hypothetical protein
MRSAEQSIDGAPEVLGPCEVRYNDLQGRRPLPSPGGERQGQRRLALLSSRGTRGVVGSWTDGAASRGLAPQSGAPAHG